MLYTKKTINLFLLLLLLAATVTACMAEEHLYGRDGEPPVAPTDPTDPGHKDNVTLQFSLQVTAGVESEDGLLDEMDGFTIYLFDDNGYYLRQENVTREFLLAHDNTVTLDMAPGNYQMVCWGNANTYSMITNLKTGVHIGEAAIVHTATQGGKVVVVPNGDPLYFAPRNTKGIEKQRSALANGELRMESKQNNIVSYDGNGVTRAQPTLNSPFSILHSRSAASGGSYAFIVPEQGKVTADIDFTMAHKKLRIYVKDFKGTDTQGATDCPEVRVGAVVCGYNFLLQPVEGAQLAMHNRTTLQTDTRGGTTCPTAGFNAPLFTWDDQLNIDVINPADGKVRYSLNLIEQLKKQNINPADENVGEIRIDINFEPGSDETFDAAVSITIPNWDQKPVVPELN